MDNKIVKSLGIIFSATLILIIIAIVALFTLLNPNDFKDEISKIFYQKTQHELMLKGDIAWIFFPKVGFKITDIAINSDKDFTASPFLKIGRIDISVKIIPLLSKRLKIDKLVVKDPVLNLCKNAQEENNWQDLVSVLTAMRRNENKTNFTEPNKKSLFNFNIAELIISNAKIAYFDPNKYNIILTKAYLKNGNINLPMSFSRNNIDQITFSGILNIGNITFGKICTNNVKLKINYENGKLSINILGANLYQGTVTGKANLDFKGTTTKIAAKFNLDNISVQPLLQDLGQTDRLSATGHLEIEFISENKKDDNILHSLNGAGNFIFTNGAWHGVDIAYLIDQAKAIIKQKNLPPPPKSPQTKFGKFTGSFKIAEGILQNDDLLIRNPHLRMNGKGSANLLDHSLDFHLKVDSIDSMTSINEKQNEKQLSFSLPMIIKGTFSSPKIELDIHDLKSRVMKTTLKEKIEYEVGKQLRKHLNIDEDGTQAIIKKLNLDKLFDK